MTLDEVLADIDSATYAELSWQFTFGVLDVTRRGVPDPYTRRVLVPHDRLEDVKVAMRRIGKKAPQVHG